MRKIYFALTALALIPSPAPAAETYSFEIGGRRIHIDVPDNCDDLSCVSISLPGERSSRPSRPLQPSSPAPGARPGGSPPASAAVPPTAPPPAASTAPSPPASTAAPRPVASAPPAASPPTAAAPNAASPAPPAPSPAPPVVASAPPVAPPSPPPVVAAASPIGVWVTEKNEGRVRIEACGQNLCGYALQGDANGKQVLIDMRQTRDNQWSGRINDVKHGGVYQSNMTLRGANDLRVEGCAMGGMICGGQTWKRE